jgi:hypothetical protein
MRAYSVYQDPGHNIGQEIFIKESFSCGAFFFNVLWALYCRAWLVFGVSLLILGFLYGAWHWDVVSARGCFLVGVVFSVLLGLQASEILGNIVENNGFIMVAIVLARDREAAEARFFSRHASV